MTLRLVLILSCVSLAVMTLIDWVIGASAEFLNAFSAFERLVTGAASAGDSIVARSIGGWGELLVVICVNIVFGLILAGLVVLLRGKWSRRRQKV